MVQIINGLESGKLQEPLSKPCVLYSLKPIGVGTEFVESMTSYVSRLAEAHSLSLYTLVTKEFSKPFNRTPYSLREMFFRRTREVLGFSKISNEVANTLGLLTGWNNLGFLTCIHWGKGLGKVGLLKKNKSWCPECIAESRLSKVVYEPLIWNLESVKTCKIHRHRLESECPFCGKRLPLLCGTSRIGYCPHCGCWLGCGTRSKLVELSTEELNWQEYVLNCFGHLFELAPRQGVDLSVNKLKLNLKCMLILIPPKDYKVLGFNRKSISEWISGKYIPNYENLLRIGYLFRVPLIKLLLGDVTEPNYILDNKAPVEISKQNLINKNDLEKFIEGSEKPSIKAVCWHFGCSDKTLKRSYPEISAKLISISENNKEEARNRKNEYIFMIKKVMEELFNNGVYPSKKKF